MPSNSTTDYLRVSSSIMNRWSVEISGAAVMVYNTTTTVCDKPTHEVEIMPIIIDINFDSNSGVYSALQFIKDEHSKWKLPGIPLVCFDTPLWRRAMVVKHHKNLTIFILQGNFHKQLCDQASIGWITKTQLFLKLSPQSMAKIWPRTFSMAATMRGRSDATASSRRP